MRKRWKAFVAALDRFRAAWKARIKAFDAKGHPGWMMKSAGGRFVVPTSSPPYFKVVIAEPFDWRGSR